MFKKKGQPPKVIAPKNLIIEKKGKESESEGFLSSLEGEDFFSTPDASETSEASPDEAISKIGPVNFFFIM